MDTSASMSEADEFGDSVELSGAIGRESAAPAQAEKHICPYCGLAGPRPDGPCTRCTIEDSPQTRQATKARIGPWYVLQSRNPAAPGMKWSTLLALVKKGQVTPRSVVRGPTTHQLWRLASQVKGLSREFNVCYSCGGQIDRTANQCPHCDRLQEPPANPDQLLETRDLPRKTDSPESGLAAEATSLARREAARPDAGLLTAKELAAAFQLDFSPEDGGATLVAPAPVRQPVVSSSAGSRANQAAPAVVDPVETKPHRSAGRVVMVLLLLGLVGFAAVVWLNPPYQAVAREWLASGLNTVTNQFKSDPSKSAAAVNNQTASQSLSQQKSAARQQIVPNAEKATEPKATLPTETRTAAPPSVPVPNVVIPSDPESIRQLVRSLRSAAIDAETAGDYRKAVAQYEQIRRMPREYWPSDLDLRLEDAKSRSK